MSRQSGLASRLGQTNAGWGRSFALDSDQAILDFETIENLVLLAVRKCTDRVLEPKKWRKPPERIRKTLILRAQWRLHVQRHTRSFSENGRYVEKGPAFSWLLAFLAILVRRMAFSYSYHGSLLGSSIR